MGIFIVMRHKSKNHINNLDMDNLSKSFYCPDIGAMLKIDTARCDVECVYSKGYLVYWK